MGTCRFVLNNFAEAATVKSGTGGTPPAAVRSEVAPFVMERCLNADRRSLWKSGAQNATGAAGWQIDLDLGGVKAVQYAGIHGIDCPGGIVQGIWIGATVNDTNVGDADLVIHSLTANGRDYGYPIGTFSKRYWWLYVQATAAPVIGRLVLGTLTDLGLAPNPGAESTPFRNRLEQGFPGGSFNLNELGDPGRDFSLSFDPVASQSQWDAIEQLSGYAGSLIYLDPADRAFEVIIRGGRVRCTRSGAELQTRSLEMARLP